MKTFATAFQSTFGKVVGALSALFAVCVLCIVCRFGVQFLIITGWAIYDGVTGQNTYPGF